MGIPIRAPGLPIPDSAYPDVVVIYPAPTGTDDDGAPNTDISASWLLTEEAGLLVAEDGGGLLSAPATGTGTTLRCQVQDATTGRPTRLEYGEAPAGFFEGVILTKTDPGPLVAMQQIAWISHDEVDLSVAVVFTTNGAAQPPGSHGPNNYRISAGRRV